MRIIYPNLFDSLSDIAASSEVATMPVENLQSQRRGKIWRSTSVADQTITGNSDGVLTIDSFALNRHNLSANATIRLRIYSAINQGGSVLYDSGVVSQGTDLGWGEFPWGMQAWGGSSIFASWSYRFSVLWFTAVTTARSFKLDISDPANADGHFEAARMFLGEYLELSEGAARGSGWWWEENSKQARTKGGSLRTENRIPFRRWEIKLDYINQAADLPLLLDLCRDAGLREDMFLSMRVGEGGETERDAAGVVKIVALPKITTKMEAHDIAEAAVVFEES